MTFFTFLTIMNSVHKKEVSYLPKKIDNVRAEILKVATKLFYKEDFNDISMRKIATDSNVGLGTVYNYFNSKEELLAEVFENNANEKFEKIKLELEHEKDRKNKLKAIFFIIREEISKIDNIQLKNMITTLNESPINKKEILKEKCIDFHCKVIRYMKDDLNLRNEIVSRIFFATLMWAAVSGNAEFDDLWPEFERLL